MIIMPDKVIGGYRDYFTRNQDPNLQEALKKYGENAVYAAIDAWKKESGNPSDIPVEDIIRMLSEENKLVSHP